MNRILGQLTAVARHQKETYLIQGQDQKLQNGRNVGRKSVGRNQRINLKGMYQVADQKAPQIWDFSMGTSALGSCALVQRTLEYTCTR